MELKQAQRLDEVTAQDVLENPSAYGFPTFSEYRRNPKKWDQLPSVMGSAYDGTKIMPKLIKTHDYGFISPTGKRWRSRKLEEIDRIVLDHGYTERDLEMKPEMEQVGGGKYKNMVWFRVMPSKVRNDE